MKVLLLELQDFRSYERARLEPAAGVNLLVGANGLGKTNLLEALVTVATGRSPRSRKIDVLVRRGAERARLRAVYEDAAGVEHELVVLLERGGGRKLRLDGKPARKLSELLGRLPVVQLFPEDLATATGSPGLRRTWLDALASACVPGYVKLRLEFERVLRQRNAVLKARRSQRELDSHTPPFLDRAARVHAARAKTVVGLRRHLEEVRPLFETEAPGIDYWAAGLEPRAIRERLAGRLDATGAAERRLLATQVGPHRDDLRMRIGGEPVDEVASRGQLRTFFLELRLAEAGLVQEARGTAPVLVLDDALSDMDEGRRRRTLGHLTSRGQVLLSVPEPPGPPPPGGATFSVASGTPEMVV